MSLPTARLPHADVGAAGDQGPRPRPRADTQVHRMLRRREPAHRRLRLVHRIRVRCGDVRYLPEAPPATSSPRQAFGRGARQRGLPSRETLAAVAAPPSAQAHLDVSAALQPPTCADRAGLEACSSARHPQPLLRYACRSSRCGDATLRPLASTKLRTAETMRHYLGRRV